ncbi:MAG: asparagine synthase (glutamine-hydrolyzing) [Gammaproteobacteria bacterium]|nr:asparagine synthase (glutamine-hydrolyzing) [Gammaproteobacteria bacterium]
MGNSERNAASLRKMMSSIEHRGPDACGVFTDAGVALGHRRLKIIDLSEAGAQPMTFGDFTVVYNGESYNFNDLRRELQGLGHTFVGHSDTEVLLHAYDAWGMEGLERLEGMFAFALWDAGRKKLILVRDRLGIKPLFYHWDNGRLLFGSEIKTILAVAGTDRDVDQQALSEYLWYGNAFEDRTIFRSIRSLLPGHRLILENGRMQIGPWWKVEEWLANGLTGGNREDVADAVREKLDAAVERQLVADVPVCIFLSGGVDSSSIAASAAIASGRSLTSYAVGFDFAGGVNELPRARRVADELGLDHHELHVNGAALQEVVSALVESHDEPFADAANIPLYLLARELSGTVKVALQGDGGDEMFAGYRRYALLRNYRYWKLWPRLFNRALLKFAGSRGRRLARLGVAAGNSDPAMRMALLLTMETLDDPPIRMLGDNARRIIERETDPFRAFRRCADRFAGYDEVQQMLLTDMHLQLPSQFLPKVDRATMAHGLETRVPLLDDRVAALAVTLPSHFKVAHEGKKIALRDACRGRLPDEILDGPKTGFGVPYGEWIRDALHEFARQRILDERFVERFGFDRPRLQRALEEHRTHRRERGFLLWKLLNLSIWSARYLY